MIAIPDYKRTFDRNRLLALAEKEGLAVRAGRMQCPKRCSDDPRGASVSDSPDGALWACHRCGAGGSVIDFMAALRDLHVDEVLRRKDELLGAAPVAARVRVNKPQMNGAHIWEKLSESDPPSESYLKNRGLESALPFVRCNNGRTGDAWLDMLASKGYRLAVPLRDMSGAVLDFQLRSVNPAIIGREAKRSLCGERPKGCAFGRPDLVRAGGRIYVTEGMADTLALQSFGVVVIGAPGCDQLRHLVKLIPDRADVVLCPQNDPAQQSQRAFSNIAGLLFAKDCTVRILSTDTAYKDPAEWLKAAPEQFRKALSEPPLIPNPKGKAEPPKSPTIRRPLTDLGNAERLVARHGEDMRYSKVLGWLNWEETRWMPDDTDQVMRYAKQTARSIYAEAEHASESEVRKSIADYAKKSESESKLRAMVSLAASEERIPVRISQLDAEPWLFTCQNGTIDLRTGALRPHKREDLITKLAPVEYDADAQCPRWLQFLDEVQPDPEVRGFLKRFVGYSLTGIVRDHVFVVNYGSGRNGKGVFTNTLLATCGDYARPMPTELLMQKHGDAHPTERSELLSIRLAVAGETEEGKALNVALVKQLTGGDQISARKMHKDFFTFMPTHKLMLATNYRPRIKETKDAIWQRLKLVEWGQSFTEERQDPLLEQKLRAELPGVLRWAVEGCLEWQERGLVAPEAVRVATNGYRSEEDPVGAFIEERCWVGANAKVTVREMREAYEKWCAEQGDNYPLGPRLFNERVEARDCRRVAANVLGTVVKVWSGIGLLSRND